MGILAYCFLLPYNFLFCETAGFRLNAPASPRWIGLPRPQLLWQHNWCTLEKTLADLK
ncbi:hypothetical protein METHB2_970001 [Candidatus Methylobacter favarea]|uniref:Uncharacterized protein n=1 Tax=Candidatus Methylobacter favarea TaxID=2707345 RepID=A0A8S0XW82_9GAMM|nr:hypothetical protein METHB2_970001 [Candidatus Methylobacter favarea]